MKVLRISDLKENPILVSLLEDANKANFQVSFPVRCSEEGEERLVLGYFNRKDREIKVFRTHKRHNADLMPSSIPDIIFVLAHELRHIQHVQQGLFDTYYEFKITLENMGHYLETGLAAERDCDDYGRKVLRANDLKSRHTQRSYPLSKVAYAVVLQAKGYLDSYWKLKTLEERKNIWFWEEKNTIVEQVQKTMEVNPEMFDEKKVESGNWANLGEFKNG